MKFLHIYEDLLVEERPYSDEKLDKVISALPSLLFQELSGNAASVRGIPQIEFFKKKAKELYGDDEDVNDPEILLLILNDHLDDFINRGMNATAQTRFINQLKLAFPRISEKIDELLGKFKKYVPGGRGRPPKQKKDEFELPIELRGRRLVPIGKRSTDEPLQTQVDFDPSKFEDEPYNVDVEPQKVSRRGRPKLYDDELTAMQRWNIKKEGPEAIDKLQKKHDSIQSDVNKQLERMRKIMSDIETRKKYFGLE